MIGSIRGTVLGLIRGQVIIDVGGVGYRVALTADAVTNIVESQELFLWTYLAVRENAQDLYGFNTKEELQFFELLLTVSGIGPKSALTILNSADVRALQNAISHSDAKSLAALGVGKKTAEKVVLELREKVGSTIGHDHTPAQGSDGEVVEALISLGFSAKEARDAAREVSKTATTEEKIREAIRAASRA